jgi:hypothetical protein
VPNCLDLKLRDKRLRATGEGVNRTAAAAAEADGGGGNRRNGRRRAAMRFGLRQRLSAALPGACREVKPASRQ